MALYQEIIFLQHFYKGFWVVENVKPYYEPLIKPTTIIGKHYFWSNYNITTFNYINHPNFITSDSPEQIENFKNWLGINYDGNIYYEKNHSAGQVLRNCVHPEVGAHVLNCIWRTK
jgi:DNA (cytosine-5)-methyltransferase 1